MNPLARTAAIRMTWFLLFLAGLIIVPAGSVRFWQGWLYWLVFSASAIVLTIQLLRHDPELAQRRMRAGPVGETRVIQKIIQSATLILYFAMLIVPGLDHRYGWSNVPAVIVILADAVVIASFVLVARVFRANTFAAATIQVEARQRVITTGLYAYVRHPMYVCALPMIAAMPIALGSWWAALLALPFPFLLAARILDEERLLAAELSGYAAYCHDVPWRLIPRVW